LVGVHTTNLRVELGDLTKNCFKKLGEVILSCIPSYWDDLRRQGLSESSDGFPGPHYYGFLYSEMELTVPFKAILLRKPGISALQKVRVPGEHSSQNIQTVFSIL
jgi:hypothetical protein